MMTICEDTTRNLLDEFASKRRREIGVKYREDCEKANSRLVRPRLDLDSPRRICARLVAAAAIIEAKMAEIARRRSAEDWLGLLRHLSPEHLDATAIPFVTSAVWRHASGVGPSVREIDGGWTLSIELTEADMFDAFRLALLGQSLCGLVTAHRRCGKGARLRMLEDGTTKWCGPSDVDECLRNYDRRRPRLSIANDAAQPMRIEDLGPSTIVIPAELKRPIDLVSAETGERVLQLDRFWPVCLNDRQISLGLALYGQELAAEHGLTHDELLLAINAMGSLCIISFPPLVQTDDDFRYVISDDASEEPIRFMLNWSNRGAIWHPRERLATQIASWIRHHGAKEEAEARRIAKTVINRFSLQDRRSIDVVRLDPYPFMIQSEAETVYVDFLAFHDFLRSVVEGARSVQQVAHGDRFRNFLAGWIRDEVGESAVLGSEVPLPTDRGRVQADLLLRWGDAELFVECKAFRKSRDFWFGTPAAVADRSSRIRNVVRETRERAALVQKRREVKVDWAVCMPDVEFLCPLDEHGWLVPEELPRVVTPEELIAGLAKRCEPSGRQRDKRM
jgi:hypothetical protein